MRINGLVMICAVSLAITSVVNAEECAFQDGGYCVPVIANTTAGTVVKWVAMDKRSAIMDFDKKEGQLAGVTILNYYESLWDELVKAKVATQKEREEVFDKARKAGGTKIGGVNLVVLAAGTLQQLIDKDILTKEEAQRILDEAKVK